MPAARIDSPTTLPVPGLDRLDDLLHLGADPRPESARVDRQLERAEAGRVGRQRDLLDVHLVPDQLGVRGERRGVRVRDGEPRQRQPDPQLARLAQAERRAADGADQVHRVGQLLVGGPGRQRPASRPGARSARRSGRARSPRWSAAAAARLPGRPPRARSTACRARRWSPAQNRSRDRRMYQLVSTSRYSRSSWQAVGTLYSSSSSVSWATASMRVFARM